MRSSKVIKAEIDAIRSGDKRYNSLQNEGGEGYERNSVPQSLYDELMEASEFEFKAIWTPEYWEAVRKEWNETGKKLAESGRYKNNGELQRAIEKATGYDFQDMAHAKRIYG